MIEIPVPIHLANKLIERAAEQLRGYGLDPKEAMSIEDHPGYVTIKVNL